MKRLANLQPRSQVPIHSQTKLDIFMIRLEKFQSDDVNQQRQRL